MEKSLLLSVLGQNLNKHKERVCELLKIYDLTILGRQLTDQEQKDICNRVLSENAFFAEIECSRGKVKICKGDRITDETFDFLMSEEDFQKYQDLQTPYLVAQNICDEKGYFVTNWYTKELEAMNELSDFIIDSLLPDCFAKQFSKVRHIIVYKEKLIDIIRKAFTA